MRGLADRARALIILGICSGPVNEVNDQRVITRRGCCGSRRPGIGAGGVGGPNSRSKNDGPEE